MNKLISNKLIVSVMTFVCFSSLFAQHEKVDSLIGELNKYNKQDTIKAKLLMDIVYNLAAASDSRFLAYSNKLFDLSSAIKFEHGIAYSSYVLTYYYLDKPDWDKLKYYNKIADSLYSKLNAPQYLAGSKQASAIYYSKIGDYENALILYQKTLDIYIEEDLKEKIIETYWNISNMYGLMERYQDQEETILKAIKLAKEIDDKELLLLCLHDMGVNLIERGKFKEGKRYLNLALDMEGVVNFPSVFIAVKLELCDVYINEEKYDIAMEYINEAILVYDENQELVNLATAYFKKSSVYWAKKEYDSTFIIMNKGLSYIIDLEGYETLKGYYFDNYYQRYKSLGRYQEALEAYEKANEYKSGIFSIETSNKISELKEKYESDWKERENRILKDENKLQELKLQQNNYLIISLIVLLVFIFVITILLIRNNNIKNRQNTLDLEQKLLRSQMNPHFIFNALMSIQSFVFKNEPKEAGKYLSSFAKLMRSILENSKDDFITLSREIEWLSSYVELQTLRFENEIVYQLQIDESIDIDNTLIPPMLTQPFIENAFEHGFCELKGKGNIVVIIKKNKLNNLFITIEDDGAGFDNQNQKTDHKEHQSRAISITTERLKLLNKSRRKKINFSVDSKSNVGTKVIFEIPIFQNKPLSTNAKKSSK